jgi:hypothetical protein
MRTSTLSTGPRGDVVSLSDVTLAIANAATAGSDLPGDPKRLPTLGLAASMKPVIPAALLASSLKSLDEAMAGTHPAEPMFWPTYSRMLSASNSFVKRTGPIIEKGLVVSFETSGFVVFKQVAMPISDAARALVANNDVAALKDVSVAADAPASGRMTVFDLLVYNPATKIATLIEVKRGNGVTEARKTGPIGETLLAGALQVKAYLKARGLEVRRVDAKVIDYYGHSGFRDDLRITGDQLDSYFRAPVRAMVEALLSEIARQARLKVRPLLESALAELFAATQAPRPAQPPLLTLPNGLRVRPEHMASIEVRRIPRRLKSKGGFKANGTVIALAETARPSGNPRTTPL